MSSLTKSQKEKGLIALTVVLLLALTAYSYFMVYAPAKEARLQAEQALSSEREVLIALQTQLKELPETEKISTSELQQKVSVEALTELIVLQIEKAELISGTLVDNIGITEGLVTLPVPVEGLENLQEVLTTVTVKASTYKEITTFIEQVEAMERIMIVEAIDFGSNEEVTTTDQVAEPIDVNVTFSAYFRPDLIALADTLPKVDAPAPAGKVNPLPQNGNADATVKLEEEKAALEVDVDVTVDENASASEE